MSTVADVAALGHSPSDLNRQDEWISAQVFGGSPL
jgi:hypothetical protein